LLSAPEVLIFSSSLKFVFNSVFSYTSFAVAYPAHHTISSQHTRNVLELLVTGHDVRECPVPYRQTGDESKVSKGGHPTMNHGRNWLFKLEKDVRVEA